MHYVFRFQPKSIKNIRKHIMCLYISVAVVGPSELQIHNLQLIISGAFVILAN
jgi:hypothetical protein